MFVVFGSIFLNVVFPTWWVLRVRGDRLAELGIRADNWRVASLVSAVLTLVHLPALLTAVRDHPEV